MVYILLKGNGYEGYGVEGVFSTLEKAQAECDGQVKNDQDCYMIEEWDVDGKLKSVYWPS